MVYNNQKIDLNSNLASFSCNDELSNNFDGSYTDTTLRLECFGHSGISRGYNSEQNSKNGSQLVLGLGPTPSIYSNSYSSSSGINRNKKEFEADSVLRLGLSHHSSTSNSDLNPFSSSGFGIPVVDEGSTSGKKSGGYIPSLLLAPRISTPSESSVASHGGRRRCSFKRCSSKAHGGGIRPQLFHGVVWGPGHMVPDNQSLSGASVSGVSNSNGQERSAKRRQLIPPQVLVPSSMKSSAFSGGVSSGFVVPEGRVHGGSLLSLLRGNIKSEEF